MVIKSCVTVSPWARRRVNSRLMSRRDIKLICFDLGRVLLRLCDGWDEACRSAGIQAPGPEHAPTLIEQFYAAARRYEVGAARCEQFFPEIAGLTGLAEVQARAAWGAWTRSAYTGAQPLLERLRAVGLRLACLSNTNAHHWQILHDPASHCFFPMDRFDHCFASHLIGAAKPDSAIYEHVERETGFGPQEIVFFDDLLPNVTAAMARGWNAFQITADEDPPQQAMRRLVSLGVL